MIAPMNGGQFRCRGEWLVSVFTPGDLEAAFLFLSQKKRKAAEITRKAPPTTPPTTAPVLIDTLFPLVAGDVGASMPDDVGVVVWLELE